jgi:hypothetical protein
MINMMFGYVENLGFFTHIHKDMDYEHRISIWA